MFDIVLTSQQLFMGGIALMLLLFVVIILPARRRAVNPYEALPSILTPAEQRFYRSLSSALKGRAIIMAKVRIADILKVRGGIKQKYFWSYFSRISQKHIDFVLLDPQTFDTICVIELDDKSHLRFDRMKRDRFIGKIMAQTGIPLHRFAVRRRHDRGEILEKLGKRPSTGFPDPNDSATKGGV